MYKNKSNNNNNNDNNNKETSMQVFSTEFCESFKNTHFTKHLPAGTSETENEFLNRFEANLKPIKNEFEACLK